MSVWEWHLQCPGGCLWFRSWLRFLTENSCLLLSSVQPRHFLSWILSRALTFPWGAENLVGPRQWWSSGVCLAHSEAGLVEVLRRCRVTHNNDVFCSGRSCPLSHYPQSCLAPLRAECCWWAVLQLLSSCNAASLLLIWSLVRGSYKPMIKVATKVPSMKWNLDLWISVSLAYHHLTIFISYFIAAEGSQQNFHCMVFYYILLHFYSSLGETVFC